MDIGALKAVLTKKALSPQMRREAVLVMQVEVELSQRRACGRIGLSHSIGCSVEVRRLQRNFSWSFWLSRCPPHLLRTE